jgi:flagellar M-ring protein FliF
MDFVNKAYAQLADVFKTMTPGSRIAVGVLLAAIVVALVYLFQYQVTSGDEYLLGGCPFYGDELTRAEAAFAKAGLNGSQIADGNRIRIPRGKKEQYLAALAESSALPADFYKYLDEAAASDNPFSSTKSLEMRRWNAKQKELALIISRLKGISSATVQFDETTSRGSLRSQTQKRAMVAVQTLAGELDDNQIKAIRNIVVGSYAGLKSDDVSINDITSGRTYSGVEDAGGSQESLYALYKQRYEQDWKQKLEDQLSWIQNAIVNVNVQLSPEVEDTTQQVTLDPKPITLSSTEYQKDQSTTTRELGGRPGAVSNEVQGNRPLTLTAGASAPETQSNESRSQVENLSGHTFNRKAKAPLSPNFVTAAIQFPMSHVLKVWRQTHPTPAGQSPKEPDPAELDKIRNDIKTKIEEIARNLLPPFATGTNPYPHITVQSYDDLKGEEIPAPTVASQAGTWFADNWRSLAMLGVGAFCLLMLRSMVKSTAAPTPIATAVASEQDLDHPRLHLAEEEEEIDAEHEKVLRRRFEISGPNLKQELQELVKEDPDAAATILRNWIGDAA